MSGKLGFVSRLARQNARFFTTSKSKCSPFNKEEFQTKQRLLQADEREIHIKGGKTHFYITSAVGVVTIGLVINSWRNILGKFS